MIRAIPISILLVALSVPAFAAGGDTTYFDATNSIIDRSNPVGTQWHELYPNFCQSPYTILAWADNGNGYLDSCDVIEMQNPDLTTSCHHVVEVTYTLELTQVAPPGPEPLFWDYIYEDGKDPLTDPVCTEWVQIYPELGVPFHIATWEDNESGELDLCDQITDDAGYVYHVEGVHTDMVTEPEPECPTDATTWSTIKALYK
jgi:hypothetical protein